MATGRYRTDNQAEFGCPATGPFGIGLRRGVVSGNVVHNPTPLFKLTGGFRDFIGAFTARPANNTLVGGRPGGYRGILPLDEQPHLFKQKPWTTGGSRG